MSGEQMASVTLKPQEVVEVLLGLERRAAAYERDLALAAPGSNYHAFCTRQLEHVTQAIDTVQLQTSVGIRLSRLTDEADRAEAA